MYRKIILALIFLIATEIVSAAHISGTVYDYNLKPASDVVISVNSVPRQQYISKNGTYAFELPVGSYVLSAKSYNNGRLEYSTDEIFNITADGSYILDLIMFPSLDEEENLMDDFDIDVSSVSEPAKGHTPVYLLISFSVLAAGLLCYLLFIWVRKKRKKHRKIPKDGDDVAGQALGLIKAHKRITQKEIRKEIPMSDAKISLVLTELEDKGLIQKIKKGRGNVIILK